MLGDDHGEWIVLAVALSIYIGLSRPGAMGIHRIIAQALFRDIALHLASHYVSHMSGKQALWGIIPALTKAHYDGES